ncbi:MAG: ComEC/Rec2 family competence protein [Flavobacteriaceae bacterium]
MKWFELSLVPSLLMFILGVHFAYQTELFFKGIDLLIGLGIFVFYLLTSSIEWPPLTCSLFFFVFGIFTGQIDQQLPQDHYTNAIDIKHDSTFYIELVERLRPNNFYHRFYAEVNSINHKKSSGRVVLLLSKKGTKNFLKLGDQLNVVGQIQPIKSPLNPFDFNYKEYLYSQKIYHQLVIDNHQITNRVKTKKLVLSIKGFLLHKIDFSQLNPATKNIIKTMLLGEKNSLERSQIDQYAKAGIVHLFAISGLHVGLLLFFFQRLLYPLKALPNGSFWQMTGILILLWSYAFLAGASASIIRSVTLFSAYQIGVSGQRRLPTAYLVMLSMGVLLFFYPRYLLQLGFQMSYLAVFGILFLQPLLRLNFTFRPLQWFWNLTTVSVSAQIAVMPLSIYHFHQFPGLFFLSNWVVLPFVGLFLYTSLLCIVFLVIHPLPALIVKLMDSVVIKMNQFVVWVSEKEDYLWTNLSLSEVGVLLLYLSLVFLLLLSYQKRLIWFALGGVCFINFYFHEKNNAIDHQLWIAHRYGETLLIEKNNRHVNVYSSDSLPQNHKTVANYVEHLPHKLWSYKKLQNVYAINQTVLYVVDGDWILGCTDQKKAILLLSHNPKINLDRVLKDKKPQLVIIDGSNTPYHVKRWKKTLLKKGIPFHITSEQGAYKFILENEK